MMTVGSKVVYPNQGPCMIGPIVNKVVNGQPVSFYHLILLDDSGGELFIPVEKAPTIGIRLLVTRSEIPQLLEQLRRADKSSKDWRQRAHDNLKLLSSGSAFDLAEIVESLTELSETKGLSYRENQLLERARKLLICEISEVMGETKSEAEAQVNQALKSAKKLDLEAPLGAGQM